MAGLMVGPAGGLPDNQVADALLNSGPRSSGLSYAGMFECVYFRDVPPQSQRDRLAWLV